MPTITKYIYHQGNIEQIIARYSVFEKFKYSSIDKHENFRWIRQSTGETHYHALISFFGKSGYGKSSTVNALLGQDILKTSDVEACTRRCDTLDFKITDDYYLSFADYPGIGESEYRDKEYLKMYQDFLVYSNIVVYVLRGDMRDYSIDELAYSTVFAKETDKKKVIFAVNCCDKIEPISRSWRELSVS
jgi:predicted GTPase